MPPVLIDLRVDGVERVKDASGFGEKGKGKVMDAFEACISGASAMVTASEGGVENGVSVGSERSTLSDPFFDSFCSFSERSDDLVLKLVTEVVGLSTCSDSVVSDILVVGVRQRVSMEPPRELPDLLILSPC